MNRIAQEELRILAIAPSTRGFGFAVLEVQETLVDWGVKTVKGDKNMKCLAKVEELIAHYEPGVIVLQNTSITNSRRAPRIKELNREIIALAATKNVRVRFFSVEQVRNAFFADDEGTKYALAELLAKRFPDELGSRVPPKRKPWMSEDYRMDIFGAVALVLMLRLKMIKRAA